METTKANHYQTIIEKKTKLHEKFMEIQDQLWKIAEKENKIVKECFNEWEEKLRIDFPKYEIVREGRQSQYIYVYLCFGKITLELGIKYLYSNGPSSECYYGIDVLDFNKTQKKEVRKLLSSIIPPEFELKKNDCSASRHTTIEKGYSDFKNLIEHIENWKEK
jgi:hypothetical protein